MLQDGRLRAGGTLRAAPQYYQHIKGEIQVSTSPRGCRTTSGTNRLARLLGHEDTSARAMRRPPGGLTPPLLFGGLLLGLAGAQRACKAAGGAPLGELGGAGFRPGCRAFAWGLTPLPKLDRGQESPSKPAGLGVWGWGRPAARVPAAAAARASLLPVQGRLFPPSPN